MPSGRSSTAVGGSAGGPGLDTRGVEQVTFTSDRVAGDADWLLSNQQLRTGNEGVLDLLVPGNFDQVVLQAQGASRIDLRPGAYSSGNAMTNNLAIAYGTTIENAVGGSGNDRIMGNAVGNVLSGGSGADTLAGGDALDILYGGDGDDEMWGGAIASFADAWVWKHFQLAAM